jgi:hypothetical protein
MLYIGEWRTSLVRKPGQDSQAAEKPKRPSFRTQ